MSRRRSIALLWGAVLAALVLCGAPSAAMAFHVGKTFSDAPGAGGGGRIFYVGTPLERGWDCTMCHIEAPELIKLRVDVQPSELFQSFRYTPGASYRFSISMQGEHLGGSAGRSNFNGLSAAFTDDGGIYQGSLGGFAAEVFFDGSGVIASAGTNVAETSWAFDWTAPDPGAGRVTLYVGAVDGNGAGSGPDETRTDPFGDDVFVAAIALEQGGAGAQLQRRARDVAVSIEGGRRVGGGLLLERSHMRFGALRSEQLQRSASSDSKLERDRSRRDKPAAMWVIVAAIFLLAAHGATNALRRARRMR